MSGLDAGRARPDYEPRALQCPHCGAPLTIRDDRARFTVCDSCDSELELTQGEANILGKRDGRTPPGFALEVGDSCTIEGHRYEVAARLRTRATDDDPGDPPVFTYLLYSPRRSSRWLSHWAGEWDLSQVTHVAPMPAISKITVNAPFKTHDGEIWVAREIGRSELTWVDGALPYIARKGDISAYIEASRRDQLYAVEQTGQEIGFTRGRKLTADEVVAITGQETMRGRVRKPPKSATGPMALLLVISFLTMGIMAFFTLGMATAGEVEFRKSYSAWDLAGSDRKAAEVMTEPMQLGETTGLVEIKLKARGLSNAWQYVDLALIDEKDQVIHVDGVELSRYSGVSGGESWTEDGSRQSRTWHVQPPGTYRLLIRAAGAQGATIKGEAPVADLDVTVVDGIRAWWFAAFGMLMGLGGVVLSIAGLILGQKGS